MNQKWIGMNMLHVITSFINFTGSKVWPRVFVLLFCKITGNDEITGGTMKRLQCGRGFCHVTTMASLIQIILKLKLGLNTVSSGPFRCLNQNRKFLVWNLFSESSVKSSWPGMTSSKNNSLFKRSRWPNLISRQWIAYQRGIFGFEHHK